MSRRERTSAGEDAWAELYRAGRPRVYALCLRMTGNAGDAEDLTQDVFVRAAGSWAGFRGEAAATTWLYRIARNACIDHLRRRDSRRSAVAPGEAEGVGGGASAGPEAGAERAGRIDRALARLRVEDREIVVLGKCVGLGSEALGEVLDCSAGAARVRLHRALVRLRTLFDEEEASDGL